VKDKVKRSLVVIATFFFMINVYAQSGQIDSSLIARPVFHFQQEYTFDTPVDPQSWQKQKPGLNISFASTDESYFRTDLPAINRTQVFEGTGWRGERINAMILAWAADTIEQVRFMISDLKTTDGKSISKDNLQLSLVRYVLSNYPYDATEVSCGEGPVDKAYLMPDRLEAFERFTIPGRTVRPVWVSINIPSNAPPGLYSGSIQVNSGNGATSLRFTIKVQDQTLPKPYDWTFRLDLWQNPWVIAAYYHVKPWSAEHITLLEKHLKLYAGCRRKIYHYLCRTFSMGR
jgi:hypothetical protein